MKILFLSRSYYPNVGGVEKHIHELSKRLVEGGHQVVIITEDNLMNVTERHSVSSTANNITPLGGMRVLRIPITTTERRKKFQIWKWLWRNRQLIARSDVVHAHDVFYWYLPFRFLYFRKKVFTTFHGYESYPIRKKAIIYRKIFEVLSHGTICVGEFMKKWYHANPTFITYGAVDMETRDLKLKKNSAIFIGRLDDQTGIKTYVDAVKRIRKEIPDFTLTIFGDGPLINSLKGEGIIMKGFDRGAENEIKKYELAFVSRYLSILEAMAAERPVFAVYDNPVKEDYLRISPFKDWIAIHNTSTELADDVIYHINNKELSTDKVKSARDWTKDMTWDHLSDLMQNLWGKTSS